MSFLDQFMGGGGGPLDYSTLYPRGTRITCPACGHVIAVANRDILPTDPGTSKDWDSPYPMAGFANMCPQCGENQLRVNPHDKTKFQIHTPEGWR